MSDHVPAAVAFFDVDETLIDVKSMFDFQRHYLQTIGAAPEVYAQLVAGYQRAAGEGVPREEINRSYYRSYAGHDVSTVLDAGRSWFATVVERGLFLDEPLARLASHRKAGTPVVLISGSFFACLDPIAEAVGATWAIGTRPVVREGLFTGEVLAPMIGRRKARAASAVAGIRAVPLSDCAAYGDHASDLDLLLGVGQPTVVGDDPVLAERARREGWPRLAARRRAA